MNAFRFLIGTTRARCLALASGLAWASLAGCADTSPECRDLLAQAHERAERGNLDAQFKLGQMYEHGECVAVDMRAAAKSYRQAADSGHAGAQKVLGFMYAATRWARRTKSSRMPLQPHGASSSSHGCIWCVSSNKLRWLVNRASTSRAGCLTAR